MTPFFPSWLQGGLAPMLLAMPRGPSQDGSLAEATFHVTAAMGLAFGLGWLEDTVVSPSDKTGWSCSCLHASSPMRWQWDRSVNRENQSRLYKPHLHIVPQAAVWAKMRTGVVGPQMGAGQRERCWGRMTSGIKPQPTLLLETLMNFAGKFNQSLRKLREEFRKGSLS